MTGKSILVPIISAIGLLLLISLAVRHSEIVTGRYITSGVPPVLAFAGLLFFLLVQRLWRWLRPHATPDPRQALLLYTMLTIGVWLGGPVGVRAFLPHLTALQYWSKTDPSLAPYPDYLPAWYAPKDAEVNRVYYEGSREGIVPWDIWLPILFRWSPFFLALFGASYCLMLLVRNHWFHAERLTFPLLNLPMALAVDGGARYTGGTRPLLKHPLLWGGIAVAGLFNFANIGRALNPLIPAPGFYFSFHGLFPDRPWQPLNSILIVYLIELIGFGYFIPLEVTFSAWFLYLVEKAVAVGGIASGYDKPGFPFMQEQAAGAFLACGLLLAWGVRHHLAALWHRARRCAGEERTAFLGLAACSAVMIGWAVLAGLAFPLAVAYFLVIGCFVLVYARMRAETGIPSDFIYPYGLPKEMIVHAVSVNGIITLGGVQSMVIFSSLAWLSRHHMGEAMAAYQIDGMKLADQTHIGRRVLFVALLTAFVVGMAGTLWAHLTGYYQIGSNLSAGGMGEYRAKVALQEYQQMAGRLALPPPRDWSRLGAVGIGFCVALGLGMLRRSLVGMPLHPFGYILATAYGDEAVNFFPLFTAWLAKLVILRVGGLRLYRRGMPFFLGLIIGHFTIAGIFWPILSLFLSPEASRSYHLYLGG